MNKSELILKIAEDSNITKVQAAEALDSFFGAITETLNKDEKVQLIGFGTFSRATRKARKQPNPRNPKEILDIPEKKVVKFKPGKRLSESVM